jgi:quinol monooxygenase YgiN
MRYAFAPSGVFRPEIWTFPFLCSRIGLQVQSVLIAGNFSAKPKSEGVTAVIVVTSTFKSVPGKRAQVLELARPCIGATRKEKGCVRYELFVSSEDDITMQFIEEWTDLDSLRNHLKSSHLLAFKEQRKGLVEEGGILKIFEAKETSLQ